MADRSPAAASAAASDIPVLPDLVTVVPFELNGNNGILLQAEVDGHRGTFIFDTGSPLLVLNASYLQPSADGGIDTATAGGAEGPVTLHTLHIGTLLQQLPAAAVGAPDPDPTNARIQFWSFLGSSLGTLGINAMEPFETIFDYTHRRLVLIRLDSAGHRLAEVPAFTPKTTMPLVPVKKWWGLAAILGETQDSLVIDTGNGVNELNAMTREKVGAHLVPAGQDPMFNVPRWTLNHMVIAGQSFDASLFDKGDDGRDFDILGPPFLIQFGAVGFNLRTRQLILYH